MISVVSVGRIVLLTLVMLAVALSGAFAQGESEVAWDYRIGAGDGLQIVVWGNEQLSMSVTVRPDGMISLPLLNDVEAADRTPTEATAGDRPEARGVRLGTPGDGHRHRRAQFLRFRVGERAKSWPL